MVWRICCGGVCWTICPVCQHRAQTILPIICQSAGVLSMYACPRGLDCNRRQVHGISLSPVHTKMDEHSLCLHERGPWCLGVMSDLSCPVGILGHRMCSLPTMSYENILGCPGKTHYFFLHVCIHACLRRTLCQASTWECDPWVLKRSPDINCYIVSMCTCIHYARPLLQCHCSWCLSIPVYFPILWLSWPGKSVLLCCGIPLHWSLHELASSAVFNISQLVIVLHNLWGVVQHVAWVSCMPQQL